MPRSGWVAAGMIGAGIAADALGSIGWGAALLVASGMLLAAGALLAAAGSGPGGDGSGRDGSGRDGSARRVRSLTPSRARAGALLAIGGALVALRLAGGGLAVRPAPDPGTPPPGERAWQAEVLVTRPPRNGVGRATLRLTPDPTDRSWAIGTTADGSRPDGAGNGPWDVWATLPRAALLVAGDRFPLRTAIEPAPADGSGFAVFLAEQGLTGTVRVETLPAIEGGSGSPVERARRAAADAIGRALPEPEAGLAAGVLIGVRDGLAPTVAADFATTGLGHMVAISGWNIALVAGIASAILGAAGLGRRRRSLLAIAAIAAYALASGASASVLRAAVMGGAALAARAGGRPGSAAAILGLTVALLLLVDPAIAADIGFQLSVAATAGLLAWGERLTDRLRSLAGGRLPGWLAETLGVSLAAQAATLPIVLLHFGRLSTVSPLANLVAAPFAAPAMAVSFAGLGAGIAGGLGIPALLLAPVALAGRLVLGGLITVAHLLAAVPFASVTLPPPLDLGAALGTTMLLVVAARRAAGSPHAGPAPAGSPHAGAPGPGQAPPAPAGEPGPRSATGLVGIGPAGRRAGAIGAAMLLVLVGGGVLAHAGGRAPRLSVTVLDVGQGDAVLLEGPGGTRILVDGGPDPDRLLARLDARLPPWDRRIDLLILSHPHEDHVAGLSTLIARYRIGRVAENGMRGNGPGDQAFRARLSADGRLTDRLTAGDRIGLDGIGIDVRWPLAGTLPERAPSDGRAVNDTSIVLDLRWGARRFLLMGDAEEDVDPRLLAAGIADGGRVDLLKVAHHGSATATSDAFLAATRPLVAVASAGLGNPYGHPSPRTLARIEAAGARALRTDTDGSVTVSTDGADLRVESTGADPSATPAVRRTGTAATSAGTRRTGTTVTAAGGHPAGPPPSARAWSLLDRILGPCRIPGARTPVRMAGDPVRPTGALRERIVTGDRPAAPGTAPCYDRQRVDPLPRRVGASPPRAGHRRRPDPPHGGRRGGRELPRGARRRPRDRGRPPPRGGRGAPP